jgi:hypothetical protein
MTCEGSLTLNLQRTCWPLGDKFDENKDKYWLGTLKWQHNSQEEKTGSAPKTPPTLIQKKGKPPTTDPSPFTGRRTEDEPIPLQYRTQLISR